MISPGISLTRESPPDPDASYVLGDEPPTGFWYNFSGDVFLPEFVDATYHWIASIQPPGTGYTDHRWLLEQDGLNLYQGAFAAAVVELTHPGEPKQSAVDVIRGFGGKVVPLDFTQSFSELEEGPFKPFEVTGISPSVAITVTGEFFDRRSGHREQIVDILVRLSKVWDVTLVADSVVTETKFRKRHAAQVPGVSARCNESPTIRRPVETAAKTIGATDLQARVLGEILDGDTDEQTYHTLYSQFPGHTDSRVRQAITEAPKGLKPLGLVHTYEGPNGKVAVATEEGREFYSRHIAPQTTLDAIFGGESDGVSSDPNTPYNTVYTRGTSGEGEEGPVGDSTAGRSAPLVEWGPKWEHFAAAAGAPRGGFALLNHDIEQWSRGDRGWPGQKVSWDGANEQAATLIEYTGVLQYQVSNALALTSRKLLDRILADHRLDDGEFGELLSERRWVLHDIMCIGWLSDEVDSAEQFRTELYEARKKLRGMTLRLGNDEVDDVGEFRGKIIRLALGISGAITHVADIAGVDIVHEVRLPDFSNGFSEEHHARRRDDLAKTLAILACVESRVGDRTAANRQMFEDRPEKRRSAYGFDPDMSDPFGECLASFTLVGDGVESFGDDLRTALNERETHDDAPDVAISIPVRVGERGTWVSNVAARVATDKRIRPTTEAVTLLRAVTESAYDVARGLVYGLGGERDPDYIDRDLRPDEFHRCVAALPPERICPTLSTPTVGKMLHALCRERRALTTAELAEAANISTQSVRNNRDVLVALGLVEETDAGYRMTVTFPDEHGERYPDPIADGWLLQDTYWALAMAFLDDDESVAKTDDPVIDVLTGGEPPTPDELRTAAQWDDGWAPVLRQLVAHDRQVRDHGLVSDDDPICVGGEPEQQALPGVGA